MKILSAAQVRECDAATIKEEGITSLQLMERAAAACASYLLQHFATKPFAIFCGMGNNGGDGLAIARLLLAAQQEVAVYRICYSKQMSPDCDASYHLLGSKVKDISDITDFPAVAEDALVVDAILGAGTNRALTGLVATVAERLNRLPNRKLAIDMPTGLQADVLPGKDDIVLQVHETLTFQLYKRSFLHAEAGRYTGKLSILDIGLSEHYISNATANNYITVAQLAGSIYKPRNEFAHKGTYGTAAIVAGSYGMVGAALMATEAAARAGAGKIMALIPECGYNILQTVVPEAMCLVSGLQHITGIVLPDGVNAIGIGPGMGRLADTRIALRHFLQGNKLPLVADADALNMIAEDNELLSMLPPGSIITPHPKEFERIAGKTSNTLDATERARSLAIQHNIYIILKGRHTTILTPAGDCYYNSTGNPGMATGGSGDVLTGIITGLMAQRYSSFEAAVLGVYIHGLAGDIAAKATSQEAMLARDITASLGKAFREIAQCR